MPLQDELSPIAWVALKSHSATVGHLSVRRNRRVREFSRLRVCSAAEDFQRKINDHGEYMLQVRPQLFLFFLYNFFTFIVMQQNHLRIAPHLIDVIFHYITGFSRDSYISSRHAYIWVGWRWSRTGALSSVHSQHFVRRVTEPSKLVRSRHRGFGAVLSSTYLRDMMS